MVPWLMEEGSTAHVGRLFPPQGWSGLPLQHGPLAGISRAVLARCLLLVLHKGGPRPTSKGKKLSRLPKVAFFSVAWSTTSCQGSLGPFWLISLFLLWHLQGTTSLPGWEGRTDRRGGEREEKLFGEKGQICLNLDVFSNLKSWELCFSLLPF